MWANHKAAILLALAALAALAWWFLHSGDGSGDTSGVPTGGILGGALHGIPPKARCIQRGGTWCDTDQVCGPPGSPPCPPIEPWTVPSNPGPQPSTPGPTSESRRGANAF